MVFRPWTSIRSKILTLMTGLILACALMFLLVFLPLAKGHLSEMTGRTNQQIMELLSRNMGLWFQDRLTEVVLYSRHPGVFQKDRDSIREWMASELEKRQDPILLMIRAWKDGSYTTSLKSDAGDLSFRDYFPKVMAGQSLISEALISNSTGRPIIVAAAPIYQNSQVEGFVGEAVDLESLYSFMQSHLIIPELGEIMVLDAAGRVIAHPKTALVFQENLLKPSSYVSEEMASAGSRVLSEEKGSLVVRRVSGEESLLLYQKVPNTPGFKIVLLVSLLESEIFMGSLQESLVFISSVLILLGLGLVWLLANRISKPIVRLKDVFDRAAAGDLGVQAPDDSLDEIGKAGRSFNIMMRTIRNLTFYDAVTGLPNRAYFDDALRKLMTQETTRLQKAAVAVIALDKFKNINDAHGSAVGDRVLKEMGQRILGAAGDNSFVARGSSAEYNVFIGNLPNRRAAITQMSTILMEISKPFNIQSETLFLTASAGLTFYPQDSRDPEDTLINASIAKSSAKKSGGNTLKLFNESMRQSLSAQMHIEALLHRALEHKELSLQYQPQVDAITRRLVGMEALLRWNNKELGSVPPAVFIPLAEETGLIITIGDWVLRQACRQNKQWLDEGLPVVPVAVNVSAWQFDQGDFLDKVEAVLEETGLPRHLLELEITESVAMGQVEDKIRKLHAISESGIRISIDDFGTGYSSLNYLKQFPVHTLKIDQSFVREVPSDRDSMAIVETVITMGRNFKMEIIAEGVENLAQYDFIKEGGCHKIQGFFISRPLDPEGMREILRLDEPLVSEAALRMSLPGSTDA